jgi:Raf kinase inhibitor-like YbhB/YbcL family protein
MMLVRTTQPRHLWSSLRWVLLACALVAVAAVPLVPRFVGTGHAAPAPASANPASAKKTVFTLTSPDFDANGPMPAVVAFNQAGCVGTNGSGQNIPPTLNWKNGQTGFTGFPTLSYALTEVDYDAPVGAGFHHWVIYNIPSTATTLNATTIAESTPGMNDFSLLGYGGPCPPQDGQTHHYIFTLYALDVASLGPQGMTYAQVTNAINAAVDSHGINFVVNGATVLIGTFRNPVSN